MSDGDANIETLRQWVGRQERIESTLDAWPVKALWATLDCDDAPPAAGEILPPGGHWLYFLNTSATSSLGPDGHVRRGAFLPPVTLPRRMWAGGRIWFHRPLRIGQPAERTSTVMSVEAKDGRTGPLIMVMVQHVVTGPDGPAITEEQDLVYRPAAVPGHDAGGVPLSSPHCEPQFERQVSPDPVMLFRFSALTFNAHRIHYDRRYCINVEGYPGLVVHGPLTATLLLDLMRRNLPGRHFGSFSFRALRPLFDIAPFRLQGRCDGNVARAWVLDSQDALAVEAEADLA